MSDIIARIDLGECGVPTLIGGVLVLAVVVVVGLWLAGVRKGLVRLRRLVHQAWRQIDLELSQRQDLIPELIHTLRRHGGADFPVADADLEALTAALASARTGPVTKHVRAEREEILSVALGRVFARARVQPEAAADQDFWALVQEVTETEDRVAAGRRFYNANARELNVRLQMFPGVLFARWFRIAAAEYFDPADDGRTRPSSDLEPREPGEAVVLPPS